MKSIETTIFQYIMKQTLYVLQDGKIIEKIDVTLDNMADQLLKLSYKYNVNDVKLYGSPDYLKYYVKQVKSKEIEKYQKNKLNIEIRNKLDYI